MRLRCLLPSVLVFLTSGMLCGHADLRKTEYLPAENPCFTVVEQGMNFITVQYAEPKDGSPSDTSPLFVGIPAGATVTYELTGWDFTLVQRGETVGRYAEAAAPLESASPEIREWLDKAITPATYAFHELDLFCLTINPHSTTTAKGQDGRSVHTKVDLTQLHLTVRWTESPFAAGTETPRQDAGYAPLYESFCINRDQIAAMRRKREIPDEEKVQGFVPHVVGYAAEGALVNAASAPVPPREDAVRFTVRQTGVVELPAVDLARSGVDLATVDLTQVRIWHEGHEIPCAIEENDNGVLEEGEGIVFYGELSRSEYTADSIYTLTWFAMESTPKRILPQPVEWSEGGAAVVPVQGVADKEEILVKKRINDFEWFFMQMDEPKKPFLLDCPDLVADGTVELRIAVLNKTSGNCAFAVNVADCTTDYTIPVGAATELVFSAPAKALVASPTVWFLQQSQIQKPSFQKTGASEKVDNIPYLFIKKITYTYPRRVVLGGEPIRLDRGVVPAELKALQMEGDDGFSLWLIQNHEVVRRLTSAEAPEGRSVVLPQEGWDRIEIHTVGQYPETYQTQRDWPSSLHRTDQGYDYVILAYHTMVEEARTLAARRAAQGFRVLLTDVQDIYDEFNHGYPDVEAIVRFLRYAQSEWTGLSPEFVVLIGDSTWDHRDREGTGCIDQIPTYAPLSDPQRYAEDDYYTQLWGGPLDYFADVIIGRISVREPEELAAYLTKVATYEDQLPVGPWKARNVFISDNTFERYAVQAAETSLPEWMQPWYVNQVEYPHFTNPFFYHMFENNPDPSTREYLNKKYCPAITEDIIKGFDEGALLVQYIGHGGNQLWSHERIFYGTNRSYSDVRRLAPTDRFSFIMNWSCLTGYLNFNIPPFNVCLAEEFLRFEDKGGIAIWAPSGGGSTEYHMVLLHLNVRNLLETNMPRFGEATTQAKIEFLLKNSTPDITKQYILFGDPGVAIGRPGEQLELVCNQEALLPGTAQRFSVQTKTASLQSGNALVVMMIGEDTVYESETLDFSNGELNYSFVVPIAAQNTAAARIGLYLWNEAENLDAAGGVTIPVYAPQLEMAAGSAVVEGTQARVEVSLVNPSVFAVPAATCALQIGERIHRLQVSDIPANATVPLTWQGEIAEGAEHAYASVLADRTYNIAGSDAQTIAAIPLEVTPGERIRALLPKISYVPNELTEKKNVFIQIPLKNQTEETVTFVSVLDGPGSATTEYSLTLNPGEERRSRYGVDLPEAGTYTYSLRILDESRNQTVSFPVTVLPQPDLVFIEEDLRIEPEKPVVGRTVYFKGTVANVGQGPATNIEIQGFDGDPALGKTMTNFDGTQKALIARLEAGERAPFVVVWDPVEYEGVGEHTLHLVLDRFKRVMEADEENNTLIRPFVMHDLPDLAIDPVGDSLMYLLKDDNDPVKVWGQPLRLWARMKNGGDSDAEFARLTVSFNQEEYHTVFARVPQGGSNETQFDVPLVSARNTLLSTADKYDLVAEKDERENNISYAKRMYVKLRMPEAPIQDGFRTYDVRSETPFAAGEGEFVYYNGVRKSLEMQPSFKAVDLRVIPEFVGDKGSFVYVPTPARWQWNAKYNRFISPIQEEQVLQALIPAPRGVFDVYADLHSSIYEHGSAERIRYRVGGETAFTEIEHRPNADGSMLHKLGTYTLEEDYWPLAFESVKSASSTSIGNIRFVLAETATETPTASCGYTSPLFPAGGSGVAPVEITWNAFAREKTALRFRARWVVRKADGYDYLPWSAYVDHGAGKMQVPGKGDFLQYYVDMTRYTTEPVSPELYEVRIRIPCL